MGDRWSQNYDTLLIVAKEQAKEHTIDMWCDIIVMMLEKYQAL